MKLESMLFLSLRQAPTFLNDTKIWKNVQILYAQCLHSNNLDQKFSSFFFYYYGVEVFHQKQTTPKKQIKKKTFSP